MPTELTLTLPRPHPAQRKVLSESARWNVVACGRRWGKSTLGLDRLIEPALFGYPAAWFSPTYKMLSEVWRDARRLLLPVTARAATQEHRLELQTGGVIDMWSLDQPDSIRGRKYKRVVLDEAAMVADLGEAWNAAIRPTLTDYRGDAWFLSTPKGHNFFWQLFTFGQDVQRPEYRSWQMPTRANPIISADEVAEAERNLPERVFQQEYLAAFLDDAGGVFRKVAEAVDVGRTQPEAPVPGQFYSLGVDLARVADWTVLSVLDMRRRQVYYERFNQISWERQIEAITRVARRYNAGVTLDSTGLGDPIFEALRKQGIRVSGYTLTNQSKEQLIDALAMGLENGQVRLMDESVQTAELQAYQYELTPSRNVRMNAPAGMHDDTVIALGLANWNVPSGIVRRAYRGGHEQPAGFRRP
jgi:hypothetical protein